MPADTLHLLNHIQHLNSDLLNIIQNNNAELTKTIQQLKIDLKPEAKSWAERNAVTVGALIGIVSAAISSTLTGHFTKKREDRERAAKNREFEANEKKENKNYLKKHYGELLHIHLGMINNIRQIMNQTILEVSANQILKVETNPAKLEQYQIRKAKIIDKKKIEQEQYSLAHKQYVSKVGEYIAHKENNTGIIIALGKFADTALSYKMGTEYKLMKTVPEIQAFSKAEIAKYEDWWKLNVNGASITIINHVSNDK